MTNYKSVSGRLVDRGRLLPAVLVLMMLVVGQRGGAVASPKQCLSSVTTTQDNIHNSDVPAALRQGAASFFTSYTADGMTQQARLVSISVDDGNRHVKAVVSDAFGNQPLSSKIVRKIYKRFSQSLPRPYNKFSATIVTQGLPIEELVDGAERSYNGISRLWGDINYDGNPWTDNVSRPVRPSLGLWDRHIVVWQSHGRYYDSKRGAWRWQRPYLFGTTEDLFSQTIVVPYLIPMLENAGAVVYTPRERDWQDAEVIVDADGVAAAGYMESGRWEEAPGRGFAFHRGTYTNGENPFEAGYARQVKASRKADKAWIKYQPTLPKAGKYAVYVSYKTVDGSIDDAHYTVFHQGQATEFRVNQRMGGGTWVYLGSFYFDKGSDISNCVMLTSQSSSRGVVTADAVRFGGGMGNIERGGSVSGLPRTLEGARYSVQWAGAPQTVYNAKGGQDDYADDINSRSRMENWLGGGSVYMPSIEGGGVPFELSLALHTDAGYAHDGQGLIGSLAICTTDFNDGVLSSGVSRQASMEFASSLLDSVSEGLRRKYGSWSRRYLWDRNYSETRLPEVPSAILEMLSHQNFPDMRLAQDPNFKFTLAREIYKGILRYVSKQHGRPYAVEPLSPLDIRVGLTSEGKARLSWSPQYDSSEPTAVPASYNIYMAEDGGGFDNGRNVRSTSADIDIEPGHEYHFRVTAVNRGGESFPSEVVSVLLRDSRMPTVLIVNGFQRLSSPAVIDDSQRQGFDLDADLGVPDGLYAGWNGRQQCFDRSRMGIEGPGGLGYGGNELAGRFIMGNTHDYVRLHADAVKSAGGCNIVSTTVSAVESGMVKLDAYKVVDLILGLQKDESWQIGNYETFSESLMKRLSAYRQSGGSLLVSGAYVGSGTDNSKWLADCLSVSAGGYLKTDTVSGVSGLNTDFDFSRAINSETYAVTRSDVLLPQGSGFCAMKYGSGESAAVACGGNGGRSFVMGFPFESITGASVRARLMGGILQFLMSER